MSFFFSSNDIASFDARLFDGDDESVCRYCNDTDHDHLK